VEVRVYAFHVCKSDPFPQDHLIKRANEERIEESSVEDSQPDNSADEFEVV